MPTAQEASPLVRVSPRRTAPMVDNHDRPPSFPEDQFSRLITDGFVRRGYKGHADVIERINARDALIALLMHGGGLRVSEPFHLWVHDVQVHPEDPTQAVVRIYHPSDGLAPGDWLTPDGTRTKNRADYLKLRYARTPRHLLYGSPQWAGWKHNALDSRQTMSMAVSWRSPEFARLFLVLWTRWLRERAMYEPNHPYAFTTMKLGQRGGGHPGSIYTVSAFIGAHRRAVERIGLVAAKANGTTPHGHRHAMGQLMTDLELPPAAIMKILHHCSLESQNPYTRPSFSKANELLQRANERLRSGTVEASKPLSQTNLMQLLKGELSGVPGESLAKKRRNR